MVVISRNGNGAIKGNINYESPDTKEESFIVLVTSRVQPKEYYSYNNVTSKMEPSVI